MVLWSAWYHAVRSLRPACHRSRTFLWLVLALMGMCCRMDLAGVTSFVRVLRLKPAAYPRFLGLFHSNALDLDLLKGWIRLALALFTPFEAGGRLVLLADGIKVAKKGRKMPGVKSLHQESGSNSKAEFIMGQHLHHTTDAYREAIRRKVLAYHRYLQVGCIAQPPSGGPYLPGTIR